MKTLAGHPSPNWRGAGLPSGTHGVRLDFAQKMILEEDIAGEETKRLSTVAFRITED